MDQSSPEKQGPMADFQARCHAHGLRITPQREAIFQELIATEDHPSADQIYQRVRRRMPHVSFDTVNRTLLTLCKIGAASIVEGTGQVRRFDGNLRDHQHFRCINCKRIVDFQDTAFENIAVPGEFAERFVVLRKTVCLEGLCDKCAAGRHVQP